MRGGASGHAGGGCQRVRGGDAESKRNAPLETDASPDGHRGGRWTWHRSAMGVAFAGYGARPGCAPLTSPIVRPPRPFPGGPRGARLNWGVWLLRQPRKDAKMAFLHRRPKLGTCGCTSEGSSHDPARGARGDAGDAHPARVRSDRALASAIRAQSALGAVRDANALDLERSRQEEKQLLRVSSISSRLERERRLGARTAEGGSP